MKISKKILILGFAGLLFVSCKKAETENEETAATETAQTISADAKLATTNFTIEGMHCEVGCAAAIQKKLAKMEGVQDAKIDFEGKKATITFDSNVQSPEKLVETVEKISADYIISDVNTSDVKAYLSFGDKDKEKKAKKSRKEKKAEAAAKENGEAKKSCGEGEKSSGCCANKKVTTT
uniref:heavy-metal-associated domain-containing protein n=1 Tax=Flavobacterium sp. TaxID=239 RepID=UPI004049C194